MGLSVPDSGIFPWLLLSLMANAVGLASMLQADWHGWYHHLKKAPFSPPEASQGWIFGGAWLLLDVLDGFGFWQGWRMATQAPSYGAWVCFWLSALLKTALKAGWTPLFFGQRMIRLALLVLTLMLAVSILNTGLAYSIDSTAGGLLTPSLAWLLYAWALNMYAVLLNDVHTDELEVHHAGMELISPTSASVPGAI